MNSGRRARLENGLTSRQQKFVDAYAGDNRAAALAAGYSPIGASQAAIRLLKDPSVVAAIKARAEEEARKSIADRLELQRFWTKVLRNDNEDMEARLKATAMLARSHGMFLDRSEVTIHKPELPKVDAETLRAWARKTLPKPAEPPEEEEAEVVGPH